MNEKGKEVAVRQEGQTALQQVAWTPEQIELIKRTVAKGTTNDELQLFLYIAKRTGLDPFARQIYCMKRWDSTQNKDVMTPQTGIDGFRLVADRTGKYAPGNISWNIVNGRVVSATATIKKLVADTWHEVTATAFFEEYAQHKNDDTLTRMWTKMPKLMIGKCAEALVLRKAFPAELSGVYTHDEMMQADNDAGKGAEPEQKMTKPLTVKPQMTEDNPVPGQPAPEQPAPKPQAPTPQPHGNTVEGLIAKISSRDGLSKKSGKPYTLTTIILDNDLELKTFDTGLQKELYQANNEGAVLRIDYDDKRMIVSISHVIESGEDLSF